jgi:hypothetical protein
LLGILLEQAAALTCWNSRNLSSGHTKMITKMHSFLKFYHKRRTFIGPTKRLPECSLGDSMCYIHQKPNPCSPPNKTEPSNKELRLQLSYKPLTTNSFRQQSLSFKVIITEKRRKPNQKYLWPPKNIMFKTLRENATLNSKVFSIQNYVTISYRDFARQLLFLIS